MLAIFTVALPYSFLLREEEQFPLYSDLVNGYEVKFYPPIATHFPLSGGESVEFQIDDSHAFRANGLRIVFRKDEFDRRQGIDCDPPFEVIKPCLNSLLTRLRIVTGGSWVKLIDFPNVHWRLHYRNDDDTELESSEGFVRGRGSVNISFSYASVTTEIWNEVFELPFEYEPPSWVPLLLDAQDLLPRIGPAIVMAFTALEVAVSKLLDDLAFSSLIPEDIWRWINNRDLDKQPSPEDQFGDLLRILSGHSLKDDNALWISFLNLRKARNSFVHEGVAKNLARDVVTEDEARSLVGKANEILAFVRSNLPTDLQWPEYPHQIKVGARIFPFGD